jgi:predicted phage terminase large subunit-like protein
VSVELDRKTIEALAAKGRKSLFFFTRAILGFDKLTKDIHRPICQDLQDFEENTRVEVIVPRGWYKSTICSVAYPLWRGINDPNVRVLIAQNSFSNATKKLGEIKQIVEGNELFRACYSEVLPDSSCVWSRDCLTLKRTLSAPEGTFEAAGTGTAVVSRHYDVIIQDDTVAPDYDSISGVLMQPTQAEIEKAIGWHRLATPLLLEPNESQIVVVGTRWAERDLLSWIIENCPEYKLISRAARENGETVWDRFDDATLNQMERDLGPHMFSALMMNNPTGALNQVFKREWVQYYQNLPKGLVYVTSVDLASAEKEESSDPDFNLILTAGVNPVDGHVYVVHYTRERMDPSAVVYSIFDHYRTYKPIVVLVEAIGYQRTLVHWLEKQQHLLREYFPVEEIKSLRASKLDRVRGLQPYFAARRVHIREDMHDLERELLAFPKGSHDDLPDTLSMQLKTWSEVESVHEAEVERVHEYNPHSAYAILKELGDRVKKPNRYPADVGNIGERDEYVGRRSYDYVGNVW